MVPRPRIQGGLEGDRAISTWIPREENQGENAACSGTGAATHDAAARNRLAGNRARRPRPPRGRREPGARAGDREVLDDRRPAEPPRPEHAETAAVGELEAAEHRGSGPCGIRGMHDECRDRRPERAPPGPEPQGDDQLRRRNRDRGREEESLGNRPIRAEDPGEAGDVEELADGGREEDRPDRDSKEGSRAPSSGARFPPVRPDHFWLSVQSYGMNSTLEASGIFASRYAFAYATRDGAFFRKSSV